MFKGERMITDLQLREMEHLGILNRVFRRWLQTTWGRQSWSRHFAGQTPRQELALLYPELDTGDLYLSVHLEQSSHSTHIQPLLFSQKNTGVFESGLYQLAEHPFNFVDPIFDVGFSSFASSLSKLGSNGPYIAEPPSFWEGYYLILTVALAPLIIFSERS